MRVQAPFVKEVSPVAHSCMDGCILSTGWCNTEGPACFDQVIAKKRAEKPEVRKASREAALREVSCLFL